MFISNHYKGKQEKTELGGEKNSNSKQEKTELGRGMPDQASTKLAEIWSEYYPSGLCPVRLK